MVVFKLKQFLFYGFVIKIIIVQKIKTLLKVCFFGWNLKLQKVKIPNFRSRIVNLSKVCL